MCRLTRTVSRRTVLVPYCISISRRVSTRDTTGQMASLVPTRIVCLLVSRIHSQNHGRPWWLARYRGNVGHHPRGEKMKKADSGVDPVDSSFSSSASLPCPWQTPLTCSSGGRIRSVPSLHGSSIYCIPAQILFGKTRIEDKSNNPLFASAVVNAQAWLRSPWPPA